MAEKNRTELKAYFETGDRPTEDQFADFVDSNLNKSEDKANLSEALSSNDTKYITPKTANHIVDNAVPNATISTKGKVELATLTEVVSGTDSSRAVTPEGAKRAAETHAPVVSVNGQTGAVTIPISTSSDSGWQNAILLNGIQNYSTGSYGHARYRKKDGVVYIEGLVRNGIPTLGQTDIFILPSGYRPPKRIILSAMVSGNTVVRIDVLPTGQLRCYNYNTSWTSIGGISFLVD